jgi:uncharacterized protein YndB with AHSA1/START domain
MKKIITIILIISGYANCQAQEIPNWLKREWNYLTNGTGTWVTSNAKYKNTSEPFDKYGLEWKYGLGSTSVVGKLYGIVEGKENVNIWQFFLYWDGVENKGKTLQISPNGTYGFGDMVLVNDSIVQSILNFHTLNGQTFQTKHESVTNSLKHKTTSFNFDKKNTWLKNRTYIWQPVIESQTASSQIDTLPSGELTLTQSIIIYTSLDKVWKSYTEPEEWKKWVTPVVEMDFKINGTIKSHYDSTAAIGDKGTIVNHILNYIPYQQITMQAELNENFPAFMKGEEKNLYSIVEFERLNENKTKLTIYGIGYKNEQQWLDLLKFFIQGNEMTMNKLKKYLEQS